MNRGDKVLIKGNVHGSPGGTGFSLIQCDKQYSLEGNVLSLYDPINFRTRTTMDEEYDSIPWAFCYEYNLISAENLVFPLTTTTIRCFEAFFYGCSNLVYAPKILPATTLGDSCYLSMFDGCSSLITVPELPAENLADCCYMCMFSMCTSLTTVPELPATTLSPHCYESMFSNCTSITTAPELPAPALNYSCYANMFYNCMNLNYIKCLAIDWSGFSMDDTTDWVYNVSSTGTFIQAEELDDMSGMLPRIHWSTGSSGIPEGWDVEIIPNEYDD